MNINLMKYAHKRKTLYQKNYNHILNNKNKTMINTNNNTNN